MSTSTQASRRRKSEATGTMTVGRHTARRGRVERATNETQITLELNVDGRGQAAINTGIGFLDHMLTLLAGHGLFDLTVEAKGDLQIDEHHTAEDVMICLGRALDQALGDRTGLVRTAHSIVPMDEALALVAVDLSGRPYCVVEAEFATPRLGQLGTDLIVHLFESLANHARMNLHAKVFYGRNDHHKVEALFKALARALDAATQRDPRRPDVPSTKGTLTV
jgi:imidazoleglycerol-phosphate dehydratase